MQKNSEKTSDRTKIPRMQLFRMARIVALLKKNRLPTAQSLLKEYEKLDYENCPIQSREIHFSKTEKKERYEYLKKELKKCLE